MVQVFLVFTSFDGLGGAHRHNPDELSITVQFDLLVLPIASVIRLSTPQHARCPESVFVEFHRTNKRFSGFLVFNLIPYSRQYWTKRCSSLPLFSTISMEHPIVRRSIWDRIS